MKPNFISRLQIKGESLALNLVEKFLVNIDFVLAQFNLIITNMV